jgi:hypothetical protein
MWNFGRKVSAVCIYLITLGITNVEVSGPGYKLRLTSWIDILRGTVRKKEEG